MIRSEIEGQREEERGKDEDEGEEEKKSCEINLLCRAFTRATDNRHAQTKARTWRSCLGVIDEESKGVRSVLCKLAQAGPISTSNERPGTHMGERESERERAYA